MEIGASLRVSGWLLEPCIGSSGDCRSPYSTVTIIDHLTTVASVDASPSSIQTQNVNFTTLGIHDLHGHSGINGDTPVINVMVTKSTPVLTHTSSVTTSKVGESIQLTSSLTIFSPDVTGILKFYVTRPDGVIAVYATKAMTNQYQGLHVGIPDSRNFVFTAPYDQPGNYKFVLAYTGDNLNAAVQSNTVLVQVGPFKTTTTLQVSNATSMMGKPVTLTATVTGTTTGTNPTGSVTFKDNGTSLGTVALATSGTATLLSTQLKSVGVHSITAEYGGDTNNQPSVSAATAHQITFDPAVLIPIITELL